jgi:pimeloyl-ACP methyl ester carboxylesterase
MTINPTALPLLPPLNLHTAIAGQGFPILCLHGHPGAGYCMSVFTSMLGQRHWTIAPDLRGYGQSRALQPFAMGQHLIDLDALLDRLHVSRFVALGWSLGGILALELALRHPDRVSGLILVATAARPWGNHPRTGWMDDVLTGLASLVNWVNPGNPWGIETLGKRSLYRYLIQQHTPTAYEFLAREALPAYLQTSAYARDALNQALRSGYNRLPDLEMIQCPSLILAGEGDRHITAASSLETAKRLPNCESQIYPDVAHLFPWEIGDRVQADIQRWLDTHPEITA